MTIKYFINAALALFMASIISACGSDQANSGAPTESGLPAPPAKPDNVSSQDLSAGIEAMKTRVLRTVDALAKVERTRAFRYFMHPSMEKDAVIEFDVSGLSSVTLSPRVDLDAKCMKDPNAGVVEMSYALDDATPTSVLVDRDYDQLLDIEVNQSKKLTVAVNQGNGTVTCDWFGLGVLNVQTQ